MAADVNDDDPLLDIVQAYLAEVDAGRPPDVREVLHAHPELASQLRAFFDDQEAIADQVRPLRDALAAPAAETPPPLPPDIPGHEHLRFLARGGMGEVYRAWQTQAQREVVVKVIRRDLHVTEDQRRLFFTEARNAANLDHPHIVTIHEVGMVDGEPFFSMAYVSGGSLAGHKAALCRHWRRIAELMRTVALAVDYANHCDRNFAHRHGILHRDLKPANILLARDGSPRVADFGLAQDIAVNATEVPVGAMSANEVAQQATLVYHPDRSTAPNAGAIAGTPSYMAPEQTLEGAELTVAVDVYGLGAVLYELLTDFPPFLTDPAHKEETFRQIREDAPRPPHDLQPRVPRNLEAICLRCLKKKPADRYKDAAAMAKDLECFLEGRPVDLRTRRIGPLTRLLMWARRQPGTAALAATVLLLGWVVVAGLTWFLVDSAIAKERIRRELYVSQIGQARQHIHIGRLDQARKVLDACPADLRGWDWRYLENLCRQGMWFTGHKLPVWSVCYSPCGRWLLTGGSDGTAQLWDVRTRDSLRNFSGHRGQVTARFTDGSRLVVTVGQDQVIRVHDLETEQSRELAKGLGPRFACDARGEFVAVTDLLSQTVQVRDLRSGRVVGQHDIGDHINALAFHPDGKRLAVGGNNRKVELFQVPSLKPLPLVALPTPETVWAVTFSSDGRYLAAGLSRPAIWDLEAGKVAGVGGILFGAGPLPCNSLAFDPKASRLVGTYRDGFVRTWDLATGRMIRGPTEYSEMANEAVFTPDGNGLAITQGNSVVVEPITPRVQYDFKLAGHTTAEVESVLFNAGQVVSLAGNEILTHDTSGKVIDRRRIGGGATPRGAIRCLGRVDRLLLAVVEADNRVTVRDAKTGVELGNHGGRQGEVQALAFAPDGRLALGDSKGDVRLWAWREANGVGVPVIHSPSPVTALAFSKQGGYLATGGMDGKVRLWPVHGGQQRGELPAVDGTLTGLSFCDRGERLVSCASDGVMKVWDIPTAKELYELPGHDLKQVSAVAFDPAGGWLASSGHDGNVRLWDGRP